MKQVLTIEGWLPEQVANGTHGHWATRKKKHDIAKKTAWAYATHAGWQRIDGKARLTITYVFSQKRRRDIDNLVARSKGLIDGIKPFLVDDDSEHLELVVRAEVRPGEKGVRMELEAL